MVKRMLIDATHPEETRVVVVNGTRLEEFDVETSTKKQLKGNIYLAKVVRVEPSLQAAFVDYGGNRHGFLAFGEIHPDFYQLPVADREALKRAQQEEAEADEEAGADGNGGVETVGGAEEEEGQTRVRPKLLRNYKIQEVIRRGQIVLVQVVKEERGNKGAALTTYLSLAGRYGVLMPNTARGGGVSRKITSAEDRKRLKSIVTELDLPMGMSVILRTAGAERGKAEIKRDLEYLLKSWNQIVETTLSSTAPALIHEEGSIIKRAIRDLYSRDVEEILVEGDEAYRHAKDLMKMLTPSHAKKVQPYKDEGMPLFFRYQVEAQLNSMHSPTVQLRSGGYIVINQTEALVAIDVNSGRSTRERHIEETAYKTNLEAAEEVARQLRLRDLAGLVVIDFIDMDDNRSNASVERRLKEALRNDRARIQVGRISPFGLLELSRQRLRPSLMEATFATCQHCSGTGMVRSVESASIYYLRILEEEGVKRRSSELVITVPTAVALYILNHKRRNLADIESRYGLTVEVQGDRDMVQPTYRLERVKSETAVEGGEVVAAEVVAVEEKVEPAPRQEARGERTERGERQERGDRPERAEGQDGEGGGKRRRRRRRRKGRRQELEGGGSADQGMAPFPDEDMDEGEDDAEDEAAEVISQVAEPAIADGAALDMPAEPVAEAPTVEDLEPVAAVSANDAEEEPAKPRGRARRGGRGRTRKVEAEADPVEAVEAPVEPAEPVAEAEAEDKPRRRAVRGRKKAESAPPAERVESPVFEEEPEPVAAATEPVVEQVVAFPQPASEPVAANDQGDEDERQPGLESTALGDRPRRKGWWNRLMR